MNDEKYLELSLISERYAMEKCGFCGADDYNLTRNKKFAELIVMECISELEEMKRSGVPIPVQGGLNLGVIAVKMHFGIEV